MPNKDERRLNKKSACLALIMSGGNMKTIRELWEAIGEVLFLLLTAIIGLATPTLER